jgi:hypothetical protein
VLRESIANFLDARGVGASLLDALSSDAWIARFLGVVETHSRHDGVLSVLRDCADEWRELATASATATATRANSADAFAEVSEACRRAMSARSASGRATEWKTERQPSSSSSPPPPPPPPPFELERLSSGDYEADLARALAASETPRGDVGVDLESVPPGEARVLRETLERSRREEEERRRASGVVDPSPSPSPSPFAAATATVDVPSSNAAAKERYAMTHLRWDLQDALEAVRDEETECDSRAAAIDAAMEEAAEEERRAESSESSDADEDDETRDAKAKAKAKAPAPRGGGGLRSPSVMELSLQHARVAASRFTLRGQRERIEWALRELSALEKAASRAPEGLNVERAAALRRTILLALREDGLADRPVGAVGASSSSSSRERGTREEGDSRGANANVMGGLLGAVGNLLFRGGGRGDDGVFLDESELETHPLGVR